MTSIGAGLLGLWLLFPGGAPEGTEANRRAQEELAEGTRLYGARDYAGAQARFERSLELDPSQPLVPFLIARSVHARYRPGDKTPENLERARKAIAAYQVVLASDPGQEEAWQAVTGLYGELGEEGRLRSWLGKRAADKSVPAGKRADAYIALAARDLPCARNPTDAAAASRCAARGLPISEKALELRPENEGGWRQKASFLSALDRLAEAAQAEKRADELKEKSLKESEAVKAY